LAAENVRQGRLDGAEGGVMAVLPDIACRLLLLVEQCGV
jgi:hypothetical protein